MYYQWLFFVTDDFMPLRLYEKDNITYLASVGVLESKTRETEVF